MRFRQDKPNFLVYLAYFGVNAITLNTVYLVLPNDYLRWYLIGFLVVAMMTGYLLHSRHYITLGVFIDIAGLATSVYYAYQIYQDKMAFGTYLGEMLSILLVLRSFKLFRHQDFLPPLVVCLTLMVFSAIPSFSAEFVYSLFGFLLLLGLALFLGSIDEFARLPRRKTRQSRWRYTYDFLEDYAPVPTSAKPPKQLARFFIPAIRASVPAVIAAFVISSGLYFTVDHSLAPGTDSTFLAAFGGTGFNSDTVNETALLTGILNQDAARHYTGFDTEFNIAQGRLLENSTSTEVVMEVESNLPSFWRGKCFDTYTGRGWVQSELTSETTWSLSPPSARRTQHYGEINSELRSAGIQPDPQIYKDEIRQVFHLEANLPGVVFTAYQPVEISMPIPAVLIDDTFTIRHPQSADSMVAGQSYEVTSWKHFEQGDYLDAYDYDPHELSRDDPEFYSRFTQLPESGRVEEDVQGFDFTRVRSKAYEVTAGAETVYEQVHALEQFLKDEYNYSLNPPSAVPIEKDAIDYFLFDWEHGRGHCEYFSTSLAVLCRSIGIPARVVTGYATGNFNILKNRYVVQERHAHAWVEVFWPEIGWVEFDPTPQNWFRGIGEKAASGWLVFHNAIENLYVYDPRGFFDAKVIPAFDRAVVYSRYFMNQRHDDFDEFVHPLIKRVETETEGAWLLIAGAFTILLASFVTRRVMDTGRDKKLAILAGRRAIWNIRKKLIRQGVEPSFLATEQDCAVEAGQISPGWGQAVGDVVDSYQTARYSGQKVTHKDLATLKRACRIAAKPPKKTSDAGRD